MLRDKLITEELGAEKGTVDTTAVKVLVESCLEKTAEEGAIEIGKQGGYSGYRKIVFLTHNIIITMVIV